MKPVRNPREEVKERKEETGDSGDLVFTGGSGKGAGVTWGGAYCCSILTALEELGAYPLTGRGRLECYPSNGWDKVGAKLIEWVEVGLHGVCRDQVEPGELSFFGLAQSTVLVVTVPLN